MDATLFMAARLREKALSSITFPEGLDSIDECAFYGSAQPTARPVGAPALVVGVGLIFAIGKVFEVKVVFSGRRVCEIRKKDTSKYIRT